MANMVYRREGYVIAVEGSRTRAKAPILRIKFGDVIDGKVVPFVLSNGVRVNPSPTLTLIRGQNGNIEVNERINKEQLAKLGYEGDHKSTPSVNQFKSGASRINAKSVEIMWEVTEYGNEVKSVRGLDAVEDGSAFFTGEMPPEDAEPWDSTGEDPKVRTPPAN